MKSNITLLTLLLIFSLTANNTFSQKAGIKEEIFNLNEALNVKSFRIKMLEKLNNDYVLLRKTKHKYFVDLFDSNFSLKKTVPVTIASINKRILYSYMVVFANQVFLYDYEKSENGLELMIYLHKVNFEKGIVEERKLLKKYNIPSHLKGPCSAAFYESDNKKTLSIIFEVYSSSVNAGESEGFYLKIDENFKEVEGDWIGPYNISELNKKYEDLPPYYSNQLGASTTQAMKNKIDDYRAEPFEQNFGSFNDKNDIYLLGGEKRSETSSQIYIEKYSKVDDEISTTFTFDLDSISFRDSENEDKKNKYYSPVIDSKLWLAEVIHTSDGGIYFIVEEIASDTKNIGFAERATRVPFNVFGGLIVLYQSLDGKVSWGKYIKRNIFNNIGQNDPMTGFNLYSNYNRLENSIAICDGNTLKILSLNYKDDANTGKVMTSMDETKLDALTINSSGEITIEEYNDFSSNKYQSERLNVKTFLLFENNKEVLWIDSSVGKGMWIEAPNGKNHQIVRLTLD